jgi:hypothetical protein
MLPLLHDSLGPRYRSLLFVVCARWALIPSGIVLRFLFTIVHSASSRSNTALVQVYDGLNLTVSKVSTRSC